MAHTHPIFARVYAVLARLGEQRAGIGEHREELLAGVTGRVLEVGCGNGMNFAHYPAEVTEVVALEPEPYLRSRAQRAAPEAPVPVRVGDGVAEALDEPDGSFDAAIASLVLCSVEDPSRALAELHRVLRPGGELRFYEHVRSEDPRQARWQERVQPVWRVFAGGCHPARDTVAAVEAAGFELIHLRRFSFRISPVEYLVEPHVIGRARRP